MPFGRPAKGGFPSGVLVDDEDLWLAKRFTWHLTPKGYVVTNVFLEGKERALYLHRAIMWPQPDEQVDHKFHNRLDNRRSMLRCVRPGHNNFNRRGPPKNSSTGVLGVRRYKYGFFACVEFGGKRRTSKTFKTIEEAAAIAAQFRKEAEIAIYS